MIKDISGIQVLVNVNATCGANRVNILDHKNCICKNKLIGRVTEECTSVINETMINNNDNITNDNINLILFILFLVLFIVFLIGFIYYYWRSNADRRIK